MNRLALITTRHWAAGIILAVAGVVLVRLLAPGFSAPWRLRAVLSGQALAIGGLFVIAVGVARRIRKA